MKYEFASAEWFAALHGVLGSLAATQAARSPDFRISLCEVFLNAPPGRASQGGTLAWSCVSTGADLDFHLRERDDVEFKMRLDYALAAELARADADEPAKLAALVGRLAEARRAGALEQRGGEWRYGFDIHNVMVRLTA
jgi:hypothetical protein